MRFAAAGIALLLLTSLGAGAWYALPRWCPALVIKYSPWVQPVLRANAQHRELTGRFRYSEFDLRFRHWGSGVLPYLHQVLFSHPDARMRSASMEAIEALGGRDEHDRVIDWTVISLTFAAIADPGNHVDEATRAALGHWLTDDEGADNLDAIEILWQVSRSLDQAHRAVLIARLPDPPGEYMRNPGLVGTYADFLTHPDPAVLLQAATRLRGMSSYTVFPANRRLLAWLFGYDPTGKPGTGLNDILRCQDDQSDVSGIITWLGRYAGMPVEQMHLAYACAILRNPTTVPALTATLTTADPGVRIHTLQALRDIGDAHALDAVIPLLGDADESVRCMAVWTIGRLRDQRVPELLRRALNDSDPLVAHAAERSLAEFLPPAPPAP